MHQCNCMLSPADNFGSLFKHHCYYIAITLFNFSHSDLEVSWIAIQCMSLLSLILWRKQDLEVNWIAIQCWHNVTAKSNFMKEARSWSKLDSNSVYGTTKSNFMKEATSWSKLDSNSMYVTTKSNFMKEARCVVACTNILCKRWQQVIAVWNREEFDKYISKNNSVNWACMYNQHCNSYRDCLVTSYVFL